MITLKIKDPGHIVEIPGLNMFRTPAHIDISKLDIRSISMYLKKSGIMNYEIVSDDGTGGKEVYTKKDFDEVNRKRSSPKKVDNTERINRIEKMLEILIDRKTVDTSSDKEQINNKLDRLEQLLKDGHGKIQVIERISAESDKSVVDETDSFIPDVDITDMKLKSKGTIKTVKQDSEYIEDAADILSGLIKK